MKPKNTSVPALAAAVALATVFTLVSFLVAVSAVRAETLWSSSNIRLTLELGRLEDGQKASSSSYELTLSRDGDPAQLNAGFRIPISSTTFAAAEGKESPVPPAASFTYQNIGMSARMKVTRNPEAGSFHLAGTLDATLLRDAEAAKDPMNPPTIGNLSQSLNVDLKEGKPLRVSAVDVPGMGTVYIEIKADTPD